MTREMGLPERLRWMACDEHYKGSRYERYLLDAADRIEELEAGSGVQPKRGSDG